VANIRRSIEELKEIDVVLERLREFLRLNYMTGAEVARFIDLEAIDRVDW
jgi:hypothetical protein